MASTALKKQDLPPSGGYNPINFKRVPAKSFFNGWTMIGMYFGTTAVAAYLYYLNSKKIHYQEIEERSAKFAITPLLLAERDRVFLKQTRKNRDDEAKLMENVEGWKVGTLYSEPIFHDYNKGKLSDPTMAEYYVHASDKDLSRRRYITMMS